MIPFVEEFRGVVSVQLYQARRCKAIVDYVKGLREWNSAGVYLEAGPGQYQSVVRPDTRTASILTSAHQGKAFRLFDEKVNKTIKPLIRQIWQVDLTEHSGTQILRYPPGGHYVPHQDAGRDLLYRYFTLLCYLNDDFEGGQTWFPPLNYAVVPRTGKAILFPARYHHAARPVVRGEKFVILTWINGPVPIHWI